MQLVRVQLDIYSDDMLYLVRQKELEVVEAGRNDVTLNECLCQAPTPLTKDTSSSSLSSLTFPSSTSMAKTEMTHYSGNHVSCDKKQIGGDDDCANLAKTLSSFVTTEGSGPENTTGEASRAASTTQSSPHIFGAVFVRNDQPESEKKKRLKFTLQQTRILQEWLHAHWKYPYPSSNDKKDLCAKTGISKAQINSWFINNRGRHWKGSEPQQTHILQKWLHEHWKYPYPSSNDKKDLCAKTGLSRAQIHNWFINNRWRSNYPNGPHWKGSEPICGKKNIKQRQRWQPRRSCTATSPPYTMSSLLSSSSLNSFVFSHAPPDTGKVAMISVFRKLKRLKAEFEPAASEADVNDEEPSEVSVISSAAVNRSSLDWVHLSSASHAITGVHSDQLFASTCEQARTVVSLAQMSTFFNASSRRPEDGPQETKRGTKRGLETSGDSPAAAFGHLTGEHGRAKEHSCSKQTSSLNQDSHLLWQFHQKAEEKSIPEDEAGKVVNCHDEVTLRVQRKENREAVGAIGEAGCKIPTLTLSWSSTTCASVALR